MLSAVLATTLAVADPAAALPDMAGVAPEPPGGWKTKAMSISVPAPKDVGRFCSFVKNTLKPSGVDAIVLLVRYNYKFTSHPECAGSNAISLADAKAIKRACDEAGVSSLPSKVMISVFSSSRKVVFSILFFLIGDKITLIIPKTQVFMVVFLAI